MPRASQKKKVTPISQILDVADKHIDALFNSEPSDEVVAARYEALFTQYRDKVIKEFMAENAGPKLDKAVSYVKALDALDAELDAAADDLESRLSQYIDTGANMEAVFLAQKRIDSIQEKINSVGAVPAGCNELIKAYRKARDPKLYGQ
jgi:hypothetical protein